MDGSSGEQPLSEQREISEMSASIDDHPGRVSQFLEMLQRLLDCLKSIDWGANKPERSLSQRPLGDSFKGVTHQIRSTLVAGRLLVVP